MKKANRKSPHRPTARRASMRDQMRPSYDFRSGVRGKYVQRYREGTNVVVLEPDVAARFPDAASVNKALRALADLADGTPPKPDPVAAPHDVPLQLTGDRWIGAGCARALIWLARS